MYDPIIDSEGMPAEARVNWVAAALRTLMREYRESDELRQWFGAPTSLQFFRTYAPWAQKGGLDGFDWYTKL